MRSLISQISIHKLEVFCMVVELGSFSRAAERLGIAQPVVSMHIKAMEDKFGAQLLLRSGKRALVTEDGERVYGWARELVGRTREIEREMSERQQGVLGRAVIGASMTLGSYVLPGMITPFHQRLPTGSISVMVSSPMMVTDAILSGECDFAFTILDPRHQTDQLDITLVCNDALVLMTSDKALASAGRLQLQDLANLPFVTAQSGTPRREIEEASLARHAIQRTQIVMEFGHAEAIKQAVRAGAGLAFLFRSSVKDEVAHETLFGVDVPGLKFDVPVYLVTRKNKTLSNFQLDLIHHLTRQLQSAFAPDASASRPEGAARA